MIRMEAILVKKTSKTVEEPESETAAIQISSCWQVPKCLSYCELLKRESDRYVYCTLKENGIVERKF